jgi:hypothetical protein
MQVPSPGELVPLTEPPIASTSPLTIASPNPLPLLKRSSDVGRAQDVPLLW